MKKKQIAKKVENVSNHETYLDENILWFIYENDKPIAMWINIPDSNFHGLNT